MKAAFLMSDKRTTNRQLAIDNRQSKNRQSAMKEG
jgi:hypothetical protein